MAILFDGWFPDGNAAAKLAAHDYFNRLGVQSVTPVVEVAGSCVLAPSPTSPIETVLHTAIKMQDTRFVDASVRVMMIPITPTAGDPIVDWGGGSATARRWYRFAFMHGPFRPEPTFHNLSALLVVWQLHDQADTGDNYVEPPLWVTDDGRGHWELRNHYDPNAVTNPVLRVKRTLVRIPQTPWVWHEFVVYMKPSWTSGDLKVWYNGRCVFRETGVPNCFNHLPARGGSFNYCEYGVYGGKASQVTNREMWHKGMQIGDEAYTTFDQFMIACGSPIREGLPLTQAGGLAAVRQ